MGGTPSVKSALRPTCTCKCNHYCFEFPPSHPDFLKILNSIRQMVTEHMEIEDTAVAIQPGSLCQALLPVVTVFVCCVM